MTVTEWIFYLLPGIANVTHSRSIIDYPGSGRCTVGRGKYGYTENVAHETYQQNNNPVIEVYCSSYLCDNLIGVDGVSFSGSFHPDLWY